MSLSEIQSSLRSGEKTITDLVHQYLDAIELSRHLNIYVEVWAEEALEKARELDLKLQTNPDKLGALFGCVVSIKDLICYKNHTVTAASAILDGFVSQITATAVDAVIKQDAIIIGITNCDEFGMGSANQNSVYGSTINGNGENRIPGGSSGGCAVSVQMDTCLVSLGTDTGGSVRQPAAFTGIFGFKPSYGLVSRHGLVAYASSFDQIGVFAKDLETMDTIISLISVADNFDSTMYSQGLYRDQETRNLQIPTKIAVLKETLNTSGLQEEVKSNFLLGIEKIKETGTQIDFVSFDMVDYLIPTYYILTTAEASSNLSRYDGVRYGKRVATESLAEMYSATRSSFFGWEVKKRIMLGSFVLSEEYYDAYYTKAQQVRNLIRDKIGEILNRYDVIALPTTASVAWSRDEILDPMTVYMSDIYTVLASLCGFPAISIPSGKNGEGNHIGMQIIGKPKADKELIAIAGQFYEHINAF